jgi:hypothetical protein
MNRGIIDVIGTVRHDIERTLHRRTTPPNTRARVAEDAAKGGGEVLWGAMKRHSYVSMIALGAVGIIAADAVGVGELAVGLAVAYSAFRVLRRGESPSQAIEEVLRDVGHG